MMGRQILIELSEDEVRALEAVDSPHLIAACNCGDYHASERPCRLCAGMPVSILQKIRGALQYSLESVDARDRLGHLGRIDLGVGIAAILADEDLTSGAVRAALRRLLDET